MAGESAREVARRAREKAERLRKRAEMFEQGAEGEVATAEVLASLPPEWLALHDVRWPGRRLANVDHVLIGPGGIFVIDSKNWTGRITVGGGHLRQNGYSREKAVAAAADAALAVSEQVSAYAQSVHPVLCFVGQNQLSGCCRDVMVCSTANLISLLITRPVVLTSDQIRYLHGYLDAELRRPASPRAALRGTQNALSRPTISAPKRPQPRRRSKSKGPSLTRLLVGLAMLFALVGVGPQLAAGIGGILAEEFTKNLGTPTCSGSRESEAKQGASNSDSEKRQNGAKTKSDRETSKRSATRSSDANPNDLCVAP